MFVRRSARWASILPCTRERIRVAFGLSNYHHSNRYLSHLVEQLPLKVGFILVRMLG